MPNAVATSTSFKKGRKKTGGRKAGVDNVLSAEAKDILVRAYTERGGFKKFLEWIDSTPEREDIFYSKMWIRLLPMNTKVESHKNVVYRTYEELRVAYADKGVSLEAIEKLKRLDLKAERPKDE
jgi:hypothetical protein